MTSGGRWGECGAHMREAVEASFMFVACPQVVRQIAKQVRHCPSCASDSFFATYEHTATGLVLEAVSCESCGGDILTYFLGLESANGRYIADAGRTKGVRRALGAAGVALVAVTGWLIISGLGQA
jgi:hypothetical protein